jgi:FkbM family methyltransferase
MIIAMFKKFFYKKHLSYIKKNTYFSIFSWLNKKFYFREVLKLPDLLLKLALFLKGYNTNTEFIESKNNAIFPGEKNLIINFFNNIDFFREKQKITIVDVGANIGDFSKIFLNLQKPVEVIAFEPQSKIFFDLNNLQKIYSNFKCYNLGVGNRDSYLDLNYGDISGLASFENRINEIPYVKDNNIKTEKKRVITLDQFFLDKTIDYLKIDTEGFEMSVLEGCTELIKNNKIKIVQIEFNWHHMFTHNNLYDFHKILPNFVPYQLNIENGLLKEVDPKDSLHSVFLCSIFIFINFELQPHHLTAQYNDYLCRKFNTS